MLLGGQHTSYDTVLHSNIDNQKSLLQDHGMKLTQLLSFLHLSCIDVYNRPSLKNTTNYPDKSLDHTAERGIDAKYNECT